MSAIKRLKDKFESLCADAGVNSCHVGYVHEIATGVTIYPAVVLIPPKAVINHRSWNAKVFDVRLFLLGRDIGESNDSMTPAERVEAWGTMDAMVRTVIEGIESDPSMFQIASEVTADYNSGGGDSLVPDKVLWIEVSFKLKAYDC